MNTNEKEKILRDMEELLDEYDYVYTESALEQIVDTWATNKKSIIDLFSRHPNYREGQFMITFDQDYERTTDPAAIKHFAEWVYLYDNLGYPQTSILYNWIRDEEHNLSAESKALILSAFPDVQLHEGMKKTRAVNKVLSELELSHYREYNREFAKYADAMNPLKIVRHTIISVNPLDYLTMSFGNSWASCHTIDKRNLRGMPNTYEGQYSSGTISYMLDKTSFIMYTIDKDFDGEDYWRSNGKINRQMFHLGEDFLVQGRMYPQDNDGAEGIYTDFRNIAQKIIADCKQIPNLWTMRKGTNAASEWIKSEGTHYRDYHHYDNCTLSIRKGANGLKQIVVGHRPICIYCGNEHDEGSNINCCVANISCDRCGVVLRPTRDTIYTDDMGYHYCEDCGCECHICNEAMSRADATWIESENQYVCDDCLQEHYTRCGCCGEYVRNDDCIYVESEDSYICHDCLEEYYTQCDHCGQYFHDNAVYTCAYIESTEKWVCDGCFEEHYFTCSHCKRDMPMDEYHEDELLCEELCEECYKKITSEEQEGETA